MLGLIYPAVLGTILFQLLETFAHLLKGTISTQCNHLDQMRAAYRFDWILCIGLSIYLF
jgi:hypothetical protein